MPDLSFFIELFASGVRIGTPLAMAGVGGAFAERSGVLNIAIEGMMLVGAFVAVLVSNYSGSATLAALAAIAAGGLMATLFAYLCVTRNLEQIVCGVALNLLAVGITNVLYRKILGPLPYIRVAGFDDIKIPFLSDIPVLGRLFFDYNVVTYILFILPVIATWIMFRTSWGLSVRAVGDEPEAVDTAGISVSRVRYTCVIVGGLCAGLAGAALSLTDMRSFVTGMIAGRGFIVIAAHFCGRWNPIRVVLFCLLFGLADALQLRLQSLYPSVPSEILSMAPYVLTVVFLAGFIGTVTAPRKMDIPYVRA